MEPVILPNFMFIYKASEIPKSYTSIVPFLSTCNMFLRRSDFLLVGGFETSLRTYEDNELCLHLKHLKKGVFYQDLDTLVFHGLSTAGRNSGVFDYFTDRTRYLRTMLSTRNNLLAKYRRQYLLLLPFLDLITLPIILIGQLQKKWSLSRFKMSKSNRGYKFSWIVLYLFVLHHFLALRRFFHL